MSSLHSVPRSHASAAAAAAAAQSAVDIQLHHRSSSSSRLNNRDDASPHLSRKRRSDHTTPEDSKRRRHAGSLETTEGLLKPSIVVRAHPPNPLAKPCTLLPLMLLPREHLPLSFLDLSAPHGDLPSARQFQSHIRILDLEGRLGSNLLIACSHSGSSTFAIERDGSELYAVCRLGSHVDLGQLSRLATAICPERMPASSTAAEAHNNIPEQHALVTAQTHKEQQRRRLAIEELQSFVKRRPATQLSAEPPAASTLPEALPPPGVEQISPSAKETGRKAEDKESEMQVQVQVQALAEAHVEAQAQVQAKSQEQARAQPSASQLSPPLEMNTQPSPALGLVSDHADPPTAGTIFQNIRNQYFEALYHSMGSLAYFAKGPLSRARAAFHLDCDANLDMDDLIEFLKGTVLTTALIDKKYRETIPSLVARLRMLGDTSDHDGPKRKASKKAKKVKRGNDGLYTDEEHHIRRWWDSNKPEIHDDEAVPRPEEVKYAISSLRTRETQLQMILILEILALETMRPPAGDVRESQLPGMEPSGCSSSTPPVKREVSKKRSKHNLPLLIDVHADRLCIWQSTTADDVRAMAESQSRGNSEHSSQREQSDPLKDFCIDVVVPFFSARLPLVCDSLNHKLGGPVIVPPSRPKMARVPSSAKLAEKVSSSSSSSKQHRPKPGTAARRPAPAQSSARSLERVLSSERLRRSVSRGPNDAIAQMRSATAAPIPGLKREMSEPRSLSSIPRRGSSVCASLRERPANVLSRSVSDAAIMSSSNIGNRGERGERGGGSSSSSKSIDDPRARKKALVEAELQEAITALKKPNRGLAGKAVVEAAERRLSGQTRRVKKSGRPVGGERVQVKATPVSNRFRDVFAAEMGRGSNINGITGEYDDDDGDDGEYDDNGRLLLPGARAQQLLFAGYRPLHSSHHHRVEATPSAKRVIQATPARMSSVSGLTAAVIDDAVDDMTVAASPLPAPASAPRDIVLASSPLQMRRSRPSVAAGGFLSSGPRQPLFETPAKAIKAANVWPADEGAEEGGKGAAPALEPTPAATTAAVGNVVSGGGQTLYQQLGWDDDIDDLA